jgi:plasmid replication initiation protein
MNFFPVSTTGDLLDERNTDSVTTPVPLPVVFSQITGPFTAFDRKLWLLLLHLEWDNLMTKSKVGEWHEIEESTLRALVIRYIGARDNERFWDSIKRLTKTHVEYYFTEHDERWEVSSNLFIGAYKSKQKRDGMVRFMFPPNLVPILLEPGKFARLRVEFMLKLDSKYAVTLYQVLESVANLRVPVLEAPVNEIRGWLKVPEGRLTLWGHFYTKALFPALKEINSNPDLSGISVTHELIKSGKGGKVQRVKFTVQKTPQRVGFEKQITVSKKAKEVARVSSLIPAFNGTEIYTKAKKLAPKFEVSFLEREWRDWVIQNDIHVKNPEAHFMAFVKQKAAK